MYINIRNFKKKYFLWNIKLGHLPALIVWRAESPKATGIILFGLDMSQNKKKNVQTYFPHFHSDNTRSKESRLFFFLPALPNVTRFKCQGYVGIYVDSALNVNISES